MSNKAVKEFMLASGKFDTEKKYWTQRLEGELTKAYFPYDFNVLNSSGSNKGSIELCFSKTLTGKLNQMSNNSLPNLYIILLTGIVALLHRYMGNTDIVIGTPVNKAKEEKNLLNTIMVLRNTFEAAATYKELLLRIRSTVAEASNNQNYPVEFLLRDVGMPLENCMESLLQTLVVLRNIHDEKHADIGNFNIVFYFERRDTIEGALISLNLQYNSDLYTKETIQRIIKHLFSLLEAAVNDVNIKLSDLDILTEEEKHQLLEDFNKTSLEYPKDKTIQQLFEEQAYKTPDKIAVVYNNEGLTYKELNERANQLAGLLIQKGIKEDEAVGIMAERSAAAIIGMLGILKAGAAYLPIDTEYPKDRISYMLADSKTRILLTEAPLNTALDYDGEVILLSDNALMKQAAKNINMAGSPRNLAYIMYTSGSTGVPKGVMIEHGNVVRLVKNPSYIQFNSSDRILLTGAIVFDASTFEIWGALLNGLTLYLADKEVILDAVRLEKALKENAITILWLTSSLFNQLVQENPSMFSELKWLLAGGDVLSPQHVKQVRSINRGLKMINCYGPTENTTFSTSFVVDKDYEDNIPIGMPISNSTAYIVSKANKLQPIGVPGELWVGGDGLARGYLNRPELTQEKFINSPFLQNQRLYKTGDLARWLPDGAIEFLGRMDNQVKIRGFRIELGEIENKIISFEGIKDAAVIAKDNESRGKHICAFVVLEHKSESATKALREYLSRQLPDYMIPSYFIVLDKLPLTTNGKVNRKLLADDSMMPSESNIIGGTEYEAPRDETEQKLAEIWQEVLGVQAIGINDNFFELGGHSLKATTMIGKIHKQLQAEISLMEVFENPTIKGISSTLKKLSSSIYEAIKPIPKSQYYAPSSAQRRMYLMQQLNKQAVTYNMPLAIKIKGEADIDKIQEVLQKLIIRHEPLRTSFMEVKGELMQLVADTAVLDIQHIDLGDSTIEASIRGFIRPFDLSKAPLIRAGLIKYADSFQEMQNVNVLPKQQHCSEVQQHCSEDMKNRKILPKQQHMLLLDMHHIISDGTSMSILINEFTRLYKGEALSELRIQYKDYTAWQNIMQKSDAMKKQEAYWLEKFNGKLPELKLPTDYERPEIQSFEGDYVSFVLDEILSQKLKLMAQKSGTTLYILLLSAYNILLSKYSGQEDVIVGSPISGRPHSDLENIFGMFVNTLAMRNHPSADKVYEVFLQEVKNNALRAYENQDYQFEELIERLNISRSLNRHPIFDVMFVMQNIEMGQIEAEGLSFEPYEFESRISKFDMTLSAVEMEQTLGFTLEYCTSLFKKETIQKIVKDYEDILLQIADNAQIKIGEIKLKYEYEAISGKQQEYTDFDF